MRGSSNDRHGRWVYQNLRWHYLPEDGDLSSRAPTVEQPAPALSSLVDTRRLTDAVERWSALTGALAWVHALDRGEERRLLWATAKDAADPPEEETLILPVRLEWQGVSRIRMEVVAHLPADAPRREAAAAMLVGEVETYGAWVAQVLEQREELAQLRRWNRDLVVRVESVERRLIESCSEPLLPLDVARLIQRESDAEEARAGAPTLDPAK